MVISQADVCWADLSLPTGSGRAFAGQLSLSRGTLWTAVESLPEQAGRLSQSKLSLVLSGIDVVLGSRFVRQTFRRQGLALNQ
jgi:hypothetical protein